MDLPDVGKIECEDNLLQKVCEDPSTLAALQQALTSEPPLTVKLPKVVQRRLKALKKLQAKIIEVEAKFYEDLHLLECKYEGQCQAYHDKQKQIITGAIEPTNSDCGGQDVAEIIDDLKEKAVIEDEVKQISVDEGSQVQGVPCFWLTVFNNVDVLSEMIYEHDEPVLQHLIDVRVKLWESLETPGFQLEFTFEPNEYFSNTVLTKYYELSLTPNEEQVLAYDGPTIVASKGCTINWNPGKNKTIKTLRRKAKDPDQSAKPQTKVVGKESFFNFFNPPQVCDNADELAVVELAEDYEIGRLIRDTVIPRSVGYFTGDVLEQQYGNYEEYDEAVEDLDSTELEELEASFNSSAYNEQGDMMC